MQTKTNLEADLRAIEAINQRDVQFALANHAPMMMSQWTDYIALLPPVGLIQARAQRHRGSVQGSRESRKR